LESFDHCVRMKEDFKNVEIWADVKFVPADPSRKTVVETTKKKRPEESKFEKIIYHLKEIWRLLK